MVPVVNPWCSLGRAIAEKVNNEFCGALPVTFLARASHYFYLSPSAGPLFKLLQENCYKCRRIQLIRGRDLISPLRHLGPHNMLPGAALQLDIAGPWTVFTKSKQYSGKLREAIKKRLYFGHCPTGGGVGFNRNPKLLRYFCFPLF